MLVVAMVFVSCKEEGGDALGMIPGDADFVAAVDAGSLIKKADIKIDNGQVVFPESYSSLTSGLSAKDMEDLSRVAESGIDFTKKMYFFGTNDFEVVGIIPTNDKEAFKAFASQVTGTVIIKYGLDITPEDTGAKIMTYAYDDPRADFHAENIRKDECGYFTFDLAYPEGRIKDCTVGVPGWVNVENGIAASGIALVYGIAPEKIREALASFTGVKRRFDIHYNKPGHAYVDDYAHHPAEIAAAISSIRDIFPGRRLTAVFQPHLYTRTRDFAADFAAALDKVDRLILLDIYPAREEPVPGVTSEIIFDRVRLDDKILIRKEELMDTLENEDIDILVTFGAGNIDRYIGPVTEMMTRRYGK